MIHYADLLIRVLPRGEGGSCPVELTYSGEQELPRGMLDPEILGWKPTGVPEEDGARLFAGLLGKDAALRSGWDKACGKSAARRVRLYLDPAEPGLHALPWELMRDGAAPEPLAVDSKTPFSRHLPTEHPLGRPVFQRPLRLLAAVADPPGLDGFGCAPLDAEKEKARLKAALEGIPAEDLEITFLDGPVSLPALAEALGSAPHVLHLVAHGHFDPEVGASLYLESPEGGKVEPVPEAGLAGLVSNKESLRLVFLASCESAKRGDADAFRGLAPKLVAAGVPAVVAMQEEVEIEDAGRFAAAFYSHLLKEGVVDLAANEGRAALQARKSPFAGAPVVFLRLREGRLFGRRGEIKGEEASAFWGSLIHEIEAATCVPILGPGLLEGLLPSPGELARELAHEFGYPYGDSDNLPRVAQFVGASNSTLPRLELLRYMVRAFRRRYGLAAPAGSQNDTSLSTVIRDADWPKLSAAMDEAEVHHDLADLKLPLYVTTSFDSFMVEALKARGLNPRRAALPWLAGGEKAQEAVDSLDGFSRAEPLVLHLLGNDEDPKSMVVSEDDYLRYLARVSRHRDNFLSPMLGDTLTDQMRLFLGYRLDDLDLRVLLRHLSHLNYPEDRPLNLAVQVDPQQDDGQTLRNARQYLEDYSSTYRIRIYWGTARQFVSELHDQWERRRHG